MLDIRFISPNKSTRSVNPNLDKRIQEQFGSLQEVCSAHYQKLATWHAMSLHHPLLISTINRIPHTSRTACMLSHHAVFEGRPASKALELDQVH